MKAPLLPLAILVLAATSISTLFAQTTPSGPPLAAGRPKYFGSIHSTTQVVKFTAYFDQVTPENGGKWGSVEATRGVWNWADLDAAYNFARTNGYTFKMHNLLWGAQQPSWISSLSADQQLTEIKAWFAAVAARYPNIDLIDVVNEPIRTPPNGSTPYGATTASANYTAALGGAGTTGWDWVITAYQLARTYFPKAKLLINEYSVTNSSSAAQQYIQIVNLLKAQNLIDGIGIQEHAFETYGVASTTIKTNLDLIASSTGLPIYISEMDIDGPTDAQQLAEYQRLFPLFWEHPAVVGITLWGYRPGMWRDAQGAYLVLADGTERPAMTWLRTYFGTNQTPVIAAAQNFYISEASANGSNVGIVQARDPDGLGTLRQWQIAGGSGAAVFSIDATSGQLTVADHTALNAATTPTYTLNITVSDGLATSAPQAVTVNVHAASIAPSRLVNIATRAYCSTGNNVTIGGFVIGGSSPKHLLIRAVGPSLTGQGLAQTELLLDPVIEVHDALHGNTVIATNDNWGDNTNASAITAAAVQVGAQPLLDNDTTSSALLTNLDPGIYTFIVTGKGSTKGIVLLEIYDADTGTPAATFMNISSRAQATTGDGVAIGGFAINGTVPKQVLLRAVGPTLTTQGLGQSEVLLDPVIEVHDALHNNAIVATDDNWSDNANAAAIVTTAARIGATPLAFSDASSSALLLTLQPGVYSFVASGKNATSGIVLVEVYDAD